MTYLKKHVQNEHGVSLLPTLIILLIGTVIGLAATSTSMFEIQTASNDRIYKRNFFRTDATNQLASQLIQNSTLDDLRDQNHDWMTIFDQSPDWYFDENNWITDPSDPNVNAGDGSVDTPNTRFMVVELGGAAGTEISLGSPFMHALGVYSRYDSNAPQSRVIIQTEYRRKILGKKDFIMRLDKRSLQDGLNLKNNKIWLTILPTFQE